MFWPAEHFAREDVLSTYITPFSSLRLISIKAIVLFFENYFFLYFTDLKHVKFKIKTTIGLWQGNQ